MSAEHKCNKEADIESIRVKVDRLVKVIEGNGQKGLIEIVTILNHNVNQMNESIKSLNLTANEVLLYKAETEGYRNARKNDKAYQRWLVGFLIGNMLVIIGLILKK